MVRILRTGGRALIYVWAKKQVKDAEKSTYIKQDRKNRKNDVASVTNEQIEIANGISLPIHVNRTDFNHSDLLVPWKLKTNETLLRFYHVFDDDELEKLCGQLRNIEIIKTYYDQGNWCIILRKKLI